METGLSRWVCFLLSFRTENRVNYETNKPLGVIKWNYVYCYHAYLDQIIFFCKIKVSVTKVFFTSGFSSVLLYEKSFVSVTGDFY